METKKCYALSDMHGFVGCFDDREKMQEIINTYVSTKFLMYKFDINIDSLVLRFLFDRITDGDI